MGDLSEHFSKWEFACRCGCGLDNVDPSLIEMLEDLRADNGGDNGGKPLQIKSGCRCFRHNLLCGGNPQSEHMDGQAADIAIGGSRARMNLVVSAMNVGFNRIGVAKTFIHVDNDPFKPQHVMWLY